MTARLTTLLAASSYLFLTLTASSTAAASGKLTIGAWFPDYTSTDLSTVRWSDYDELEFFVGVTTPDPGKIAFTGMEEAEEEAYIRQFTALAVENGVTPTLSVGGWTGSRHTLADLLDGYGFKGISLDWEYPNAEGIGCNERSGADAENLLAFLKVLRAKIGNEKTISAAVSMTGFIDDAGDPLLDTSEYAEYFDTLSIMAYDVAGNWNLLTGANAPLSSSCAPEQQAYSIETAFNYWTSTGFPASKLELGVPAYSYIFNLTDDELVKTTYGGTIPSFIYQNKTEAPVQAGPEDVRGGVDVCGTISDYGSSYTYTALVENGIITSSGSAASNGGWTRYWDKCTATPFLVNHKENQFITYDDPISIAIKAHFVKEHGMKGIKFFDYTGDTKDGILAKAARKQLESAVGVELGIDVELDRQLIA